MDQVSVIIPVYNSITTLGPTLDSITLQDYPSIEIIIVDDCSDDGSYAFAKAYAQKNTSTNRVFKIYKNQANSGAGVSRNLGVTEATGRYIAFLDADDLWKPNKLSRQVTLMASSGKNICYTAYEIFDVDPKMPVAVQQVFECLTYTRLRRSNYIGNLTGIYDCQSIGKIPINTMRKRQDWAMWLDVLKAGGAAVGINEPLASYRLGQGLSSSKMSLIPYNFAIYREHLNYGFLKSSFYLLLFFYEQFVVKNKMIKAV